MMGIKLGDHDAIKNYKQDINQNDTHIEGKSCINLNSICAPSFNNDIGTKQLILP